MHLVHGAKRVDKRNEMMSELVRSLRIYRDEMDPDVVTDYAVFFGDFNYRLDTTFLDLHPQLSSVISIRASLD